MSRQARVKPTLGQVMTPRQVADLMVELVRVDPQGRVLEPSAGEGVFIDALRAKGFSDVTALEIDPEMAQRSSHPITVASFVSAPVSEDYDLVIGNPPYIRWRDLPEELREEVRNSPLWQEHFNSLSDYLAIFIARAIQVLREEGELIFITPSYWMHTLHSSSLRDFMLERGAIDMIVYFGEAQVFEGVSSSIVIFRYKKSRVLAAAAPQIELFKYVGPRRVRIPTESSEQALRSPLFKALHLPPFKRATHWTLADEAVQRRLAELEKAARSRTNSGRLFADAETARLGEVTDIANGMVSGLDAAFIYPEEGRTTDVEERALLNVAKARDIQQYHVAQYRRYIFPPSGLSEDEWKRLYPNFARHLEPFRHDLERRYSYGRVLPYWEWAFPRSQTFFQLPGPFIAVPCKERVSHKSYVRFALARSGSVATQDVTALRVKQGVQESLPYLLAYLNLPEVFEWLTERGLMKGLVLEFSERPLSQIPVRLINWDDPSEVAFHARISKAVTPLIDNGPDAEAMEGINAEMRSFLGLH